MPTKLFATMSWFYEIRGSGNRLLERKGGFATEKEAMTAGGEKTKQLTSSQGYPGAMEILSVMAGQEPDSPAFESAKGNCEARHCANPAKERVNWQFVSKLVCGSHKKLVANKPWSEVSGLFGSTPPR